MAGGFCHVTIHTYSTSCRGVKSPRQRKSELGVMQENFGMRRKGRPGMTKNTNIHEPIYAKTSEKPVHCHVPLIAKVFASLRNNLLTVGRVRFASKIIFLLSNVFALLRK